ncbi:unnamed protein product, partial [Prorocentrum cordatum]
PAAAAGRPRAARLGHGGGLDGAAVRVPVCGPARCGDAARGRGQSAGKEQQRQDGAVLRLRERLGGGARAAAGRPRRGRRPGAGRLELPVAGHSGGARGGRQRPPAPRGRRGRDHRRRLDLHPPGCAAGGRGARARPPCRPRLAGPGAEG